MQVKKSTAYSLAKEYFEAYLWNKSHNGGGEWHREESEYWANKYIKLGGKRDIFKALSKLAETA